MGTSSILLAVEDLRHSAKGPPSMKRVVEHNGCPLSYTVTGQGPAVLFIQGVGVHGEGWRPQIEELSSTFTCIAFDNRGVGQSQPAGSAITVQQMADDALAVLNATGHDRVHVVGHSLGGLIALQMALQARERVMSLGLLCTFTGSRTAAPLRPRMIWLGLRARVGTRAMRRQGFLRLICPPGRTADANALAELFGHDLADQPPVVAAQLRAMRRVDLTARLPELSQIPALVIASRFDPIAPPTSGRALSAGLKTARYVEFPDASHGLPITHAAPVNAHLRDHWLACEGGDIQRDGSG